jgi:hypothetical protein
MTSFTPYIRFLARLTQDKLLNLLATINLPTTALRGKEK